MGRPEKPDPLNGFSTIKKATKYLQNCGYKISESNFNIHTRSGFIKRIGGIFLKDDLDGYAKNNLKLLDSGLSESTEGKINLQERKLRAEIKIKEAQALKAEKENKILDGKYILKTDHNLEIAAAIGVLEAALKHGYRINGSEIIRCVEGDQKLADALYVLLCDQLDEEFNKMAGMGTVRVKIKK